jgi:hypothetical protein
MKILSILTAIITILFFATTTDAYRQYGTSSGGSSYKSSSTSGSTKKSSTACDIKKRDRLYNQCLVDRQCKESNLCKSDCLNYANKQAGCR